jgi:deoxyadenosine/deoxycytidine kinase
LETSLPPRELLGLLQQIENELGRHRTERWGPRPIDLDLLLYDELVLATPELTLPHPRLTWRRFVLEPAAEVAGSMIDPTTGWSIARLLAHLNESMPYVAITGPIAAGKSRLAERLVQAISAEKKGTGSFCAKHPEGRSGKRRLSPFLSPARLISEQPDWSRLDEFYADPAGHAWATELEFLNERARLLRTKGSGVFCQNGPARASQQRLPTPLFWVSDFWFDQSAAFARAWLPAERLAAFLQRYDELRQEVVRPRLVVLLDAPADELLARVRGRGRPCERRLTAEQLERIRQTVAEQTMRPDVGPVLRAGGNDPEAVFAEVLAAVRGME